MYYWQDPNGGQSWPNHLERLKRQAELMATRSKKRPPVHGTVMKCRNMKLAIFLNQIEVKEVVEYNVDEGWLIAYKMKNGKPVIKNEEFVFQKLTGSILVKRLD